MKSLLKKNYVTLFLCMKKAAPIRWRRQQSPIRLHERQNKEIRPMCAYFRLLTCACLLCLRSLARLVLQVQRRVFSYVGLYVRVSANAILCQNCGWKLRITPVRADG
jgi:hypothetical protein